LLYQDIIKAVIKGFSLILTHVDSHND